MVGRECVVVGGGGHVVPHSGELFVRSGHFGLLASISGVGLDVRGHRGG
jgi:hypothetical protein